MSPRRTQDYLVEVAHNVPRAQTLQGPQEPVLLTAFMLQLCKKQ